MKITNIMNFVRTFEPRDLEIEKLLFGAAKAELDLSLEMNLPSTFLLEYDALCDERYVELYRAVKDNPKIELGFWYEVVEPLTSAIGMEYNSKRGYKWDWNIMPGFAMAYPTEVRARLIDEAMRKFKEVFGFYPRTVGSWVLDTFTVNYLADNYDIDAFLICRDQISTDAYTMVGGYFSGPYYPSRNNVFTPGREGNRLDVPVFRLLGADPIHNYDSKKYLSEGPRNGISVYTLEPAAPSGRDPKVIDWFFDTYYENESLGIAYTQVGQENSFANVDLVTPLRLQYEKLKERGVTFLTASETGRLFKEKFDTTPTSSVFADRNWDITDTKALQYDSENYTANLIYHEGLVALRALYLFDDRVEDLYLNGICDTFDSVHENLPIVDTAYQAGESDGGIGIVFDTGASVLTQKVENDSVSVCYDGKSITFSPDRITIAKCKAYFTPEMVNTEIHLNGLRLEYVYKGHTYALTVLGGTVRQDGDTFIIEGDEVTLIPTRV